MISSYTDPNQLHETCETSLYNTARNSVTRYDYQQETAYEHVDRLTFSNTNSIMCLKRLMELCKSDNQTQLVHVKINYFMSLHIP